MAKPVTIRNIRDAHVSEKRPNKNFNTTARLWLAGSGSANTRYAYMFWGKPFPLGATILSAKLRVYGAGDWGGTVRLEVQRLTEKWSASKVTWVKRPAVGGTIYSLTRTNAPAKSMWEIDIAPLIQYVANGGKWFGIRISIDNLNDKALYSAQAGNSEYRPEVEIQWSDAPDAPEDLSPSGNRAVSVAKPVLAFDFTDVSGDTDLAAVHVQMNPTDSNWSAPLYDTGEVAATEPELDLATAPWISAAAFPGLNNGESIWWRVRVKDGAGIWSSFSDAEQFRRVDKGALVLNNPPDVANSYVEDVTFPVDWTLTGAVQTAYQVILTRPDAPSDWYWTSGKVSDITSVFTIPKGVIKNVDQAYRIILRVWDDIDREKTAGDPIKYEIQRDFVHQVDPTVDPVTNLQITQLLPWPWVDLTWDRGTMPDEFTILRDGEVVEENIIAAELFQAGTSYKYRDRLVAPRVSHTWQVMAVINGKNSSKGNGVTLTTKPNFTWMMRLDSSDPICIVKSASEPGPVVDAAMAGFQELHQPVGGGSPVLITQYIGGYEGHVEGVLADNIIPGLSARTMRNRFKGFKRQPGVKLLLYMVDETLEIVAYNMTYRPRAKSGGTVLYDIAFDFFEAD